MSVFDVTSTTEKTTNVRWCPVGEFDLIQSEAKISGVCFQRATIYLDDYLQDLVSTKEEAENLIKALQKAIELGWVK